MKYIALVFLTLSINSFAASNVFPIKAKSAQVTIAGEVSFPANNPQTNKAFILVGGSGAVTRDKTAVMNGLFHSLGYAVVNYDRRGNGESTGDYQKPNYKNSAKQLPLFALFGEAWW